MTQWVKEKEGERVRGEEQKEEGGVRVRWVREGERVASRVERMLEWVHVRMEGGVSSAHRQSIFTI